MPRIKRIHEKTKKRATVKNEWTDNDIDIIRFYLNSILLSQKRIKTLDFWNIVYKDLSRHFEISKFRLILSSHFNNGKIPGYQLVRGPHGGIEMIDEELARAGVPQAPPPKSEKLSPKPELKTAAIIRKKEVNKDGSVTESIKEIKAPASEIRKQQEKSVNPETTSYRPFSSRRTNRRSIDFYADKNRVELKLDEHIYRIPIKNNNCALVSRDIYILLNDVLYLKQSDEGNLHYDDKKYIMDDNKRELLNDLLMKLYNASYRKES